MPEDDETFDEDDESGVKIRELRRKAKRTDDLESEVSDLRRRLAFSDAKVDLSDDQQTALLAVIGDDLSPEAIRQKAADLKMVPLPEEDKPTPQVPAEEQAAHERVAETSTAAEAAEAQVQTLEDRMRQAMATGGASALDALLLSEGYSINAQE